MAEPKLQQTSVMLIDDSADVLGFLENALSPKGYQVRSFSRGHLALAAAAKEPPDLILLDIDMPEMDGYETCTRLKADARLAGIPVIFMSGWGEVAKKVDAFHSGGVDYMTKPLRYEEVLAHVETHLKLHNLQRDLEDKNERLEEVVERRTRQLREAGARLALLDGAKSEFLEVISHELRTTLTGLLGIGDLLVGRCGPNAEDRQLRELYSRSRSRLLSGLDDVLVLARLEAEKEGMVPRPTPLGTVLSKAMEEVRGLARSQDVDLEESSGPLRLVATDPELLLKAMRALLETAVKFSKPRGTVRITCESELTETQCCIEATGWAIPADAIGKFFDVFSVSDTIMPGGALGLGPLVAERIISLLGGSVTVENLDPPGIRLTVCLVNYRTGHNQ